MVGFCFPVRQTDLRGVRRILTRAPYITRRYLLDADTLEVSSNPHPSDVALWPQGALFFSNRPAPAHHIGGVFAQDASWHPFEGVFKQRPCSAFGLARVTDQLFAVYGCHQLELVSVEGESSWEVPTHDEVPSIAARGILLATEIEHHRSNPLDLDVTRRPVRIGIYDLTARSERCSIRITEPVSGSGAMLYAVSAAGTVAVIQGDILSLYRP